MNICSFLGGFPRGGLRGPVPTVGYPTYGVTPLEFAPVPWVGMTEG